MKIAISFILISFFSFHVFVPIQAQDIFKKDNNLYSTRELTISIPNIDHRKLIVKSAMTLSGKLSIVTSNKEGASSDNQVIVNYYKQAKTDSESKAIDFIDLIDVSLEKVPEGIQLELRAPNPAPWEKMDLGLVNADIVIPEFCEVEIDAPYFDVTAEGPFESMAIPSSFGRFDIQYVTEKLSLATLNRRVAIKNISGSIDVSTTNSSLIALDINCPDDKAIFRNDGGDIKIDGVTGQLNVKNNYGRIEIKNFEPRGQENYIRDFNGPIDVSILSMTDQQLLISNRFEDIDITVPDNISAILALAVDEGNKIEVSNLFFKPDLVRKNRLNLVVGKGKGLINGSISGRGNIFVRGINEGE